MLEIKCAEYLAQVKAEAERLNRAEDLQKQLDYLDNFAGRDNTRCELKKDGAPLSFAFVMIKKSDDGSERYWFNGGLIFHGKHDGFGSGSGPAYAVTLDPTDGWSIHT
jgi:Domain of unknown function (DUF4120)